MKKVLVIQTAYIGDVILSLPLIQSFKKKYPDFIIDFLCIPYTSEVLTNNPYINEIIIYDKSKRGKFDGIIKLAKYLKRKKYEIALIPHRSARSALIALLSGIPNRIGFEKLFFNWMYSKTVHYDFNVHEIDRNLHLLSDINQYSLNIRPELFPEINDKEVVDNICRKRCDHTAINRLIAIAPGSKWFTKRWPVEYYKEICDILLKENFIIVILGSETDKFLSDHINYTKSPFIIDLCGKLSILQTAELLKKCIMLICNDSAPVHIASCVDIPVIDIFGPTIPEFGFGPLNSLSVCVENKNLNCRPCGWHGAKHCPIKTFDCMMNVKPRRIHDEICKILKQINYESN